MEQLPVGTARHHVRATPAECTLVIPNRPVAVNREDRVVLVTGPGKVFLRVVQHMVPSDRTYDIDTARPADRRHFGAERLCELHGEGTNAAGCSVNQDLLSLPNLALPKTL